MRENFILREERAEQGVEGLHLSLVIGFLISVDKM